ncbi:hypothetical protein V8G54_036782 [Vigna mungo]|uniref:TIR domain-containing protein n=1 Tax=Vigna mungo TaxID=3915 RepID=A0AAQ3MIB1_VIGMU
MESEQCYDVYLNLKGKIHYGFGGNLYNALRKKGFKTMMSNEEMQSGSQDSPFLLRAIEQSRISIVVFSKDYPCHTSCLKELVKIVECMETKNQLVFPIFYKVKAYNVREQKKSYCAAFARHDKKFGKDSDKVRKWRSALSQVAKLRGLIAGSGYEYEHVEKVVEMVTRSLSRYDIFINFRGPDTRYSFTGFLYQALSRERFKTFIDEEELEEGDKISSSLIKAIESSRLSIVVLSENYADSSSCLAELDTIMECMKTKNQLVWPIFYKVEPTTVRNQKNTYHEAMAAHEQRYGSDSTKVSKWRQNLSEVADLKGFSLEPKEYEFKLVEEIVKKAIENDNGRYSHVTSLDLSEGMNNGDENELASSSPTVDNRDCISICSTSWNQHTSNNDDEDCFSESSVG